LVKEEEGEAFAAEGGDDAGGVATDPNSLPDFWLGDLSPPSPPLPFGPPFALLSEADEDDPGTRLVDDELFEESFFLEEVFESFVRDRPTLCLRLFILSFVGEKKGKTNCERSVVVKVCVGIVVVVE
jgi:hypothetical protein